MNKSVLFVALILACSISWAQNARKAYELYEEAEGSYNRGHYKECLVLLNDCLFLNPGLMDAYALRAAVRELLGDRKGAHTDYSIYLEKYPDHAEVLMSRAFLRYEIGFYRQAKEDFIKLLQLPVTETNAIFYKRTMSADDKTPMMTAAGSHRSYLYNYLGLIEVKLKNFEKAIACFDTAIYINPHEPDFFVNRGLVRESIGDTTASAEYRHALKLQPNHALARHSLLALESKRTGLSAEERLSITIDEDSGLLHPYLERAQERYGKGNYKGAAEDYSMALEIKPDDPEIWIGRGLAREKLNDYRGAFSDYTRAIDLKEDHTSAWLNRGNVLLKMERYEEAIEDYTVSLIYQPDYAFAYYNRAIAKLRLNRFTEACRDLRQAESMGMNVDEGLKTMVCGNN